MTTIENQPTAFPSSASILDGYVEQSEFARANKTTTRTTARYRNQGMPWVYFGGKVYIPLEPAADWLKSRVRRLNQKRRAG